MFHQNAIREKEFLRISRFFFFSTHTISCFSYMTHVSFVFGPSTVNSKHPPLRVNFSLIDIRGLFFFFTVFHPARVKKRRTKFNCVAHLTADFKKSAIESSSLTAALLYFVLVRKEVKVVEHWKRSRWTHPISGTQKVGGTHTRTFQVRWTIWCLHTPWSLYARNFCWEINLSKYSARLW